MFVLPSIRLSRGECVDTLQLPGEGEALPMTSPKEVALRFQRLGAVGLHVVDVDAAQGKKANDKALLSILDNVSIPVQCGGGVKSLKRIQELRDSGAQRVIVGSMGVLHPDWMKEAAKCFPQGLVANLDEKKGTVWIKGRSEDSRRRLEDLAFEFDAFGFEAMLLSSLNGTDHTKLLAIIRTLRTPVMVDARVGSVGDLLAFQQANVRAAILGPEIYDGRIDFHAATQYFKGLPTV